MAYHKSQKQTRRVDSESPYRLLNCSSKGDKWGVVEELEKGVEPNLADYDKRTALHLASSEGCSEVVVLLLERGADVNSTDRCRRMPLSDARSFGHGDICKILVAHGGIDPAFYFPQVTILLEAVGLDSQMPCYEVDYTEVDLSEAYLVGEGAYGEVYLVKWRGTQVAAKTIRSSIASNETVKYCKVQNAVPSNSAAYNSSPIFQWKNLQCFSYHQFSFLRSLFLISEMFHGGPSSQEEDSEKVADKTAYEDFRPPLSSYVYPESTRKLLRDCWHKNPDYRPVFEEIIFQLEFIQENMQKGKTLGSWYKCDIL
ncbi:hypothetical protein ACH5RR_024059 [Cinchona calisaya]|uniref:Uncharacterized protein n=1 Tax=Cinchona calisaya TaxID=153742 RepID=A0ABD2ZGA2_9GENT